MDWNEIQFCEDHGYCICGNDCDPMNDKDQAEAQADQA